MDGDAVRRQRELRQIDQALLVESLQYLCNPRNDRPATLYSLSVKARESSNELWLAIAKQWTDEQYEIAFHEADTPDAALLGMIKRISNNTVKWHRDKYASKDDDG